MLIRLVVDGIDQGIQGRRLTRSGGTGDENQSLVAAHDPFYDHGLPLRHVQGGKLFHSILLVEETHDDLLHFIAAGNGGDSDIDPALPESHREAAIESFLATLTDDLRIVLDEGDEARHHVLGCGEQRVVSFPSIRARNRTTL